MSRQVQSRPSEASTESPAAQVCYRCGAALSQPHHCSACGRTQATQCHSCGTTYRKAEGRCPSCGARRKRRRSSRRRRSPLSRLNPLRWLRDKGPLAAVLALAAVVVWGLAMVLSRI